MSTSTGSVKFNPWGDDHPEKEANKSPKTIGFSSGLKSLINPDSFFEQMLGKGAKEYKPSSFKESLSKRPQETVIFSFEHKRRESQLEHETQIILDTLQKQVTVLEKTGKSLAHEVTKIKMERAPKKTGIYYLRFLEWLLTIVKQLRLRVEEGQAWLSTFTQRKKKKMGYWAMYKKHGTTFGLSNERSLASQTG